MSENAPIKTLDSQLAWECKWYSIRRDRILLPNGSEGEYNVMQMSDSVWVLPVTESGEVVMIHTYRYPIDAWCWEIPAGFIEPNTTPLESAQRELLEEAGGVAADWRFLMRISTINGLSDHYGHFYLATGVKLDKPQHEAAEVVTVYTIPVEKALHMARNGEINDTVSVMVLLLAEPYIQKR